MSRTGGSLRLAVLAVAFCALVAGAAVGIAGAAGEGGEGPITVKVSGSPPVADVAFSPKELSRTAPTPVSLSIAGEVQAADGSLPPELRELAVEFDRSIEFHVTGIPRCKQSRLQGSETREALKACGAALIGEGSVSVRIAAPEKNDLPLHPRALIFNGGEAGGAVTLFVHFYLPSPVSRAFVLPMRITPHPDGRFGTSAVARFPRIAGGAGSVGLFDLEIDRWVPVGGASVNPIRATCRDGKLEARTEARFEDGTRMSEELTRACTPGP